MASLVRSSFPGESPPWQEPPGPLNLFGRGSKGEKMTFGGALDPQNRALACTGAQVSQKKHSPNKIAKVTKCTSKNDPKKGTEIGLATPLPPSRWSGGASQHKQTCACVDLRCKKKHGKPPKDQQIGPRHEQTQSNEPGKCPQETQRYTRSPKL